MIRGERKGEGIHAYIVTEHIRDQRKNAIREDLVEHNLLLLARCRLQLLLDEPRTVLVSAKLNDETKDILDTKKRISWSRLKG